MALSQRRNTKKSTLWTGKHFLRNCQNYMGKRLDISGSILCSGWEWCNSAAPLQLQSKWLLQRLQFNTASSSWERLRPTGSVPWAGTGEPYGDGDYCPNSRTYMDDSELSGWWPEYCYDNSYLDHSRKHIRRDETCDYHDCHSDFDLIRPVPDLGLLPCQQRAENEIGKWKICYEKWLHE